MDFKKHLNKKDKELLAIYKQLHEHAAVLRERHEARVALKDLVKLANFIGFKDTDKLHEDLRDFLATDDRFKLVLVPRHHLKTSIGNYTYTTSEILNNPHITILIVSSTWNLSQDFLAATKNILCSPKIERNFGVFKGDVWNIEKITVAPAINGMPDNTFTIETMGVDKGKTSKHFDLIIVDDIVERNNVESEKDRERVLRVFKDLFSLLKKPNGRMLVYGTRWHEDDLYNYIMTKMSDVFKVFHRSCFIYPDGTPCFNWDDPQRLPLFPKKFTLEALEHERKFILGDYAFSLQMMNNPTANKSKYLDFERLIFFEFAEYKDTVDKLQSGIVPQEETAIIVDPSAVIGRQTDYTGMCAVWYDNNFINIVDAAKFKAENHDIVEAIISWVMKYRIYNVYIEKGSLENSISYYLEQRLNELGLSDKVFIEGISHEGRRKESRILSIEPYLRRGKIKILRNKVMKTAPNEADETDIIQTELKREMDNFPNATHDDLTDAIGYIPSVFNMDINFFDFTLDNKESDGYNKKKTAHDELIEARRDNRNTMLGVNFNDHIDFIDEF